MSIFLVCVFGALLFSVMVLYFKNKTLEFGRDYYKKMYESEVKFSDTVSAELKKTTAAYIDLYDKYQILYHERLNQYYTHKPTNNGSNTLN